MNNYLGFVFGFMHKTESVTTILWQNQTGIVIRFT